MKRLWHRIEHHFGWNLGDAISWTDRKGCVWIAFMCSECGEICSAHMPRFLNMEIVDEC